MKIFVKFDHKVKETISWKQEEFVWCTSNSDVSYMIDLSLKFRDDESLLAYNNIKVGSKTTFYEDDIEHEEFQFSYVATSVIELDVNEKIFTGPTFIHQNIRTYLSTHYKGVSYITIVTPENIDYNDDDYEKLKTAVTQITRNKKLANLQGLQIHGIYEKKIYKS